MSKTYPHHEGYSSLPPDDHSQERSQDWPGQHEYEKSKTFPPDHHAAKSAGWPDNHDHWPPNHDQLISRKWPEDHSDNRSSGWPPDHKAPKSGSWSPDHDAKRSRGWPPNHSEAKSNQSGWALPPERKLAAPVTTDTHSIKLAIKDPIDLEDVLGAFSRVFAALPNDVAVFPSENYLYFRFAHPDGEVWGNLRFSPLDRDRGILHFAYFRFHDDPWGPDDFYSQYRKLSRSDGVVLERESPMNYTVTFRGKSVSVHLQPVDQRALSVGLNERWIQNTRDESALEFHLIYNTISESFLWVLNDRTPVPQRWHVVDADLLLEERTGFAFYVDREHGDRKILIGVNIDSIKQNNYFDGPFDQLADNYIGPTSQLADYIERAYPYTKGHIDRYGHFNFVEGSRVAITPYLPYHRIDELHDLIDYCGKQPKNAFYGCVAYDPKKAFKGQ
jgi:hypothetical protein